MNITITGSTADELKAKFIDMGQVFFGLHCSASNPTFTQSRADIEPSEVVDGAALADKLPPSQPAPLEQLAKKRGPKPGAKAAAQAATAGMIPQVAASIEIAPKSAFAPAAPAATAAIGPAVPAEAPAPVAAPVAADPFGLDEDATPAPVTKADVIAVLKDLLVSKGDVVATSIFTQCGALRMGDLKTELYGKFVELAKKALV